MHDHALSIDMIPSDPEVSKWNQSRWPSNCTGFYGHHVMWNSSIQTSSQEEEVTMSVLLQMSLGGVGDILLALRSTLYCARICHARADDCSVDPQAVYTVEIWSLHVRDSLGTSPRCLWVRTCGMRTPLIDTGGLCLAFFSIERCLLFGALNSIPHLSAQVAAVSKSALRVAQLDTADLPAVCKLVSSAKMEHWLRVDWGRSFMKMRNNTGPRTVPWGIPDFGICHVDDAPFSWTHCSLRWRKLANHSRAL